MKEGTVRTFKKQHQEELKKQDPRNDHLAKSSKQRKEGCRYFLVGLIKWSKLFVQNTRSHGEVVNTAVAIAVADALVERHPEQELNHVQYRTCTWARSLFHRMGFVRRAGTTGKVEIPAGAKKEVELTFLHEIVNKVEKFQIPLSLVLNLDQTNSKYVSMGKTAMAGKGSNSLPISGLSDKRI